MAANDKCLSTREMREARALRIEVLLLGAAMANKELRQKVLESVEISEIASDIVRECLLLLTDLNGDKASRVIDVLESWGIKMGEGISFADALINAINSYGCRRRIDLIADAVSSGDTDSIDRLKEQLDKLEQTTTKAI